MMANAFELPLVGNVSHEDLAETNVSCPIGSIVGNGRFEILKRIGSGSFGEVFLARDRKEDSLCALKTERVNTKHPQLRSEKNIFTQMKNCRGFPAMLCLTEENGFVILAMDFLGPSLEDLLNFCQRRFSQKTVLMLIDQAMTRVESLHKHSFIHRDLKPDNLLMGRTNRANILHVIDFGLCKKYRDSITGHHIPLVDGKHLTGTARYASIYTHQGIEQSRRDDLESLLYIVVYLSRGELPWMGIKTNDKRKKYEMIAEKKFKTKIEDLFYNLPNEYLSIYRYIRSLEFDQRPDYHYLRTQIRSMFIRYNFQYDYIYDWYLVGKRMKILLDRQD